MVDTRSTVRLGTFFILAALLLVLSPLPIANTLEGQAAGFVAPASATFRDFMRPASDLVLNAGQIQSLTQENADLRRRVAELETEAAALRDESMTSNQIASLLAATGTESSRYLHASVLLRDPAPMRRGLILNRGSTDGIASGQPVLGDGATLVGIISEVEPHRASVRLLSDLDSAVTAVLQESRIPGALSGSATGLQLEFVPVGAPVRTGDLVLTSALGGRLPAGVPIGRVAHVESSGQDLFETITVEPLNDFSRLEHVLILTDFVPTTGMTDYPMGTTP